MRQLYRDGQQAQVRLDRIDHDLLMAERLPTLRVQTFPNDWATDLSMDEPLMPQVRHVPFNRYGLALMMVVPARHAKEAWRALLSMGLDVHPPRWVQRDKRRNPTRLELWDWWSMRYASRHRPPDPFAPEFKGAERAGKPWAHRRALKRWKATRRRKFNRTPIPVLRRMCRRAYDLPELPTGTALVRFSVSAYIAVDSHPDLERPRVYVHDRPTPPVQAALPALVLHACREAGLKDRAPKLVPHWRT